MSCTAVHCRRWYWLCKRPSRKGTWFRKGKRCYWKTYGIIASQTVRVCQKDGCKPVVELYSGRAPADDSTYFVVSVINQASAIISALSPEKQTDVAKRIAQMDRTSPDVIKEVEKVLEQKLASLVNQDYTIVGGVDSIVDILNTVVEIHT